MTRRTVTLSGVPQTVFAREGDKGLVEVIVRPLHADLGWTCVGTVDTEDGILALDAEGVKESEFRSLEDAAAWLLAEAGYAVEANR